MKNRSLGRCDSAPAIIYPSTNSIRRLRKASNVIKLFPWFVFSIIRKINNLLPIHNRNTRYISSVQLLNFPTQNFF